MLCLNDDGSIDTMLNLESAHCYPSFPRFLSEAKRVLKPGGHFLFADYRYADLIPVMRKAVEECGLAVRSEIDITANAVSSLDIDSRRSEDIVAGSRVPGFVRKYPRHFAGVAGSLMYREFVSRKKIRLSYVLEKV